MSAKSETWGVAKHLEGSEMVDALKPKATKHQEFTKISRRSIQNPTANLNCTHSATARFNPAAKTVIFPAEPAIHGRAARPQGSLVVAVGVGDLALPTDVEMDEVF